MPTVNERIEASAWAAVRGELYAFHDRPGYCLAAVRSVIEHALSWRKGQLYDRAVTAWVQPPGYDRGLGHWARDAERSLRDFGMAVAADAMLPGDLLFNFEAAWSDRWGEYIGHVGILLSTGLIFENVSSEYRPQSFSRGALSLTSFRDWPGKPTTIIRFDPSVIPIRA